MATEDELKKTNERLVRWEENRRKQLGITNNIVLSLAVGLIGFLSTNFAQLKSNVSIYYALYFLGFSILSAIIGSLTRLYDYKKTVETIYLKKEELKGNKDHKIERHLLRRTTKRLGQWTWRMLWIQILCFLIGCYYIVSFVTHQVFTC